MIIIGSISYAQRTTKMRRTSCKEPTTLSLLDRFYLSRIPDNSQTAIKIKARRQSRRSDSFKQNNTDPETG